MPRAHTHEAKQTAFRMRLNVNGWVRWRAMEGGDGISAYLNDLIERDRMRELQDPDVARRYRMYLESLGYDDELQAVLDGSQGE